MNLLWDPVLSGIPSLVPVQVLKEHKASNPQHAAWIKALRAPFDELKAYVKKHHVAGPTWNPQGMPLPQFKPGAQPSAASQAASKPAAPPAPTPPPPAQGMHLETSTP